MGIIKETANAYKGASNRGQNAVEILKSEGEIKSIEAQEDDQLCVTYKNLRGDFTCSTNALKALGLHIKGFKHFNCDKIHVWFGPL